MIPEIRRNRYKGGRPIDEVLSPQLPTSPISPGQDMATVPISATPTPLDGVLDDTVDKKSPWINPFMEVYETTKAGAMKNLEEEMELLSKKFAHRGGYFGGRHSIAQAELAEKTGTALDQLLAQVSLGASEREYQDWLRGRGEFMNLINLIPTLLGTQEFQNIVQMPQDKGGGIGNIIGGMGGDMLGGDKPWWL